MYISISTHTHHVHYMPAVPPPQQDLSLECFVRRERVNNSRQLFLMSNNKSHMYGSCSYKCFMNDPLVCNHGLQLLLFGSRFTRCCLEISQKPRGMSWRSRMVTVTVCFTKERQDRIRHYAEILVPVKASNREHQMILGYFGQMFVQGLRVDYSLKSQWGHRTWTFRSFNLQTRLKTATKESTIYMRPA